MPRRTYPFKQPPIPWARDPFYVPEKEEPTPPPPREKPWTYSPFYGIEQSLEELFRRGAYNEAALHAALSQMGYIVLDEAHIGEGKDPIGRFMVSEGWLIQDPQGNSSFYKVNFYPPEKLPEGKTKEEALATSPVTLQPLMPTRETPRAVRPQPRFEYTPGGIPWRGSPGGGGDTLEEARQEMQFGRGALPLGMPVPPWSREASGEMARLQLPAWKAYQAKVARMTAGRYSPQEWMAMSPAEMGELQEYWMGTLGRPWEESQLVAEMPFATPAAPRWKTPWTKRR